MRRSWLIGAIAVALIPGVPGGLAGQRLEARLVAAGGTATDLRGVRSGAWSLAPSLAIAANPRSVLLLGGRVTRYNNDQWSTGGTAALLTRFPIAGALGLRLRGSGEAIRASYRATYLLGEAVPALDLRLRSVSFWAGARLAASRSELPGLAAPGGLPVPGGSSTTRSSLGPAFGGAVELARSQRGSLSLSYREEHGRPDSVPVIDRVAALALVQGPLSLGGSLGLRRASDEPATFGTAQLALALTRGVALLGAAELYPANRLTGTPGGRAITLGLSLTATGAGTPRSPRGVDPPRAGFTRLAFLAANAGRVEVAGDWNGWRPVALARSGNGVWYIDLAIPQGIYRYAFRVDGSAWKVPKGVAAVDDGFGGKSAWLTVRASQRAATQSANRKEDS